MRPERNSDSADACCNSNWHISGAHDSSTSAADNGSNARTACWSLCSAACPFTDVSSMITTNRSESNASSGGTSNRVCIGTCSTRGLKICNCTDSAGFRSESHANSWRLESCTINNTNSCSARKARTAAAGLTPPYAALIDARYAKVAPKADSATDEFHSCSCSSHAGDDAEALWAALFADGATDLSVLLLAELQRQLRAQHLQEAHNLSYSRAIASSLPSWLNLRSLLHTVSAGAAAAVAAAIRSQPKLAERPAEDASRLQVSFLAVSLTTLRPIIAVAPPTAHTSAADDEICRSGARAEILDTAGAAGAPPAAGVLLSVSKKTLQTVLQILPVLAFTESEQLLRGGERVVGTSDMKCLESGGHAQPTQLLGSGTCNAMIYRLKRMLSQWERLVGFWIHNCCRSNGSTCSSQSNNSRSCGNFSSCTNAFLAGRLCNGKTFGGISYSACCCSASSDSIYTSSGRRTRINTTQSSRVFLAQGESSSYRCGAARRHERSDENTSTFFRNSLQQLLLQILYPHALITAITWGRQAHLHEQPRVRRVAGLSIRKPRQPQPPQMQQLDRKETSQQQHEDSFLHPNVSRASLSKALACKRDCSHQDVRGQWESARSRRFDRFQPQERQMKQDPQQTLSESHSLPACLQKLLQLLQRPQCTTDERSGKALPIRYPSADAPRQRQLTLYTLQILRCCSVGGEVKQDAHEDSPVADYSVGDGIMLGEPQVAQERQQQQLQPQPYLRQYVKRHVPLRPCYRRARMPAFEPHCSVGDLGRYQLGSTSAAQGHQNIGSTGDASMKLALELLLCDSQLYIHPALPIVCSPRDLEQACWCGKSSSILYQMSSEPQVPTHSEWQEGPAGDFSQQLKHILGDKSACFQETYSKDPPRARCVAADPVKEQPTTILAVQGATYAWPAREVGIREDLSTVEQATGMPPSNAVTAGTAHVAEPTTGATERLVPDAHDANSTATTASAPLCLAPGAKGSDIEFIRGTHLTFHRRRSSSFSAMTAGTATISRTTPSIKWHPSCDFEAVAHWYRASAGDDHTLPRLASDFPLGAAETRCGGVARRAGLAEGKLAGCEATAVSLESAAAGDSLSSCHMHSSPGKAYSWPCPNSTTTLSTQISTACCAGRDGHGDLDGFECANIIAACYDNPWLRSTSTGPTGLPLVGESQGLMPVAALGGRQWQNMSSRLPFDYEHLVGHPQNLELRCRPVVVRISLLHTRGSFRSLLRTCTPPSIALSATTITAQDSQQQVESQRRPNQRQHLKQHKGTVKMNVHLPILLPELLQAGPQQSQIKSTASDPASLANSAPAPVFKDRAENGQSAHAEKAKESTRSTITSIPSSSANESRQGLPPLRPTYTTGTATRPERSNPCASCCRCNCCSLAGKSDTYIEKDRHRACPAHRANLFEVAEPEDVLVCCFLNTGAVTLNGRVVQFSDHGEEGGCLPCIVDVLLLSWYGGDHLQSTPTAPVSRLVPPLRNASEDSGSDILGCTPGTVSTCSSTSANSDSATPSTVQAISCSSAYERWRTSGGSNFASPRKSDSKRCTSSCSLSPFLLCGSSALRTETAPPSITEHTGALEHLGNSASTYVSLSPQPHICLLFLAANGTLFCSGDVPSVYLPPCITCDTSSCRGCRPSSCQGLRSCCRGTHANVPDSVLCGRDVFERSGKQCEGTLPLTAARYGTLYDAVCLPAVCAATRRPLLFGSLLASNTAAVALTSNLLLPRYKRRAPLHQRHLSFKLLNCDPLTAGGAFPKQNRGGAGHCFASATLPWAAVESAKTPPQRSPSRGCCCGGYAGGAGEAEEILAQWELAATTAGSGAAIAILQAHTGEPVLLQQHRQEVHMAAVRTIWRGDAASLYDVCKSSDKFTACTEPSQVKQWDSNEGTLPIGPAVFAGFSLRFVTLPDLSALAPPPKRDPSATGGDGPFCGSAESHVGESKRVNGREEALELVTKEQEKCMLEGADSTCLAGEVLHEEVWQPIHGDGRETDSRLVGTGKKESNRQTETLSNLEHMQDAPLVSRLNSRGLPSMPPALDFLLGKRWVACCLYRDLVLLKTASHTFEKGQFSAVGVLLTNLEKELHEWVASFFKMHPHILRGVRYMRLGCEKLSKQSRKLQFRQRSTLSTSIYEESLNRKQQNQHRVYKKRLSDDHEHEEQRRRPQQRGLGLQRERPRRPHDQQTGSLSHPQHQLIQQSKSKALANYNDRVTHVCEASTHQSVENTSTTNIRSYCPEVESASRQKTRSAPSAPVATFQSSVHDRCSNGTAHWSGEFLDLRARCFCTATASTAKEVLGYKEPGEEQLQGVGAETTAASGNFHVENEFCELEDGDGQLRLFVNTEDGGFYCLNLQRRSLEAAWPEVTCTEESRQPFDAWECYK